MRVESVTGHRPRHAILKGRTNYVCLLRLREGTAQDQGVLIPAGDLIGHDQILAAEYAGVSFGCGGSGTTCVG